jgi:hypothetical protein
MTLQSPGSEYIGFVVRHPDAAMITLRQDGTPHMARVELGVVDERIATTGSPTLVRTRNLRRDSRCSLFVFGPHPWWMALETEVTILDGPNAPDMLIRLMRARHGVTTAPGMVMAHDDSIAGDRAYSNDEYINHVRNHQLMVFQFTILRVYGNYR